MKYICLRCGFDAKQKINLERHLNRKNICDPIDDFISIEEVKQHYGFDTNSKSLQNPSISLQNHSKSLQNNSISLQNENLSPSKITPNHSILKKAPSKITPNHSILSSTGKCREHVCEYCNKSYSRIDNLTKHQKNCKKKKMIESASADETKELKETVKVLLDNQTKLEETIKELLITNQNNNNNSITNNTNNRNNNCNNTNSNNTDNSTHNTININNYGSENKDYITKDYLVKLLKEPFQAIPKLIEYTHFNKEHPENQNIKLPNKKQPYVKVLKNDKWVYADRKLTILDLIDEKHCELNNGPLIEHIENKFSDDLQDRFERFNIRYLNDDKDFTNQLYKETELVMINNS
tara:strand:- start:954 stop:2006 length:1053 start_codon:yes stop_codon:yes gene_type:complete